MLLHLGVIEIPYAGKGMVSTRTPAKKKLVKGRAQAPTPPARASGVRETVTTVQVAQWLENKYHIIELFYEENQEFIVDKLTKSLQGVLENLMMGQPTHLARDPLSKGAANEIQDRFRKFVTLGEVERLGIPGVPTKAALGGRSLRFKSKKGKGRRMSFYDTGTYIKSFRTWMS